MMACGTPVVASRRPAMDEVAGDAAALVDPDRPEEIAAVIGRLLAGPAERESMRRKGLARAALYSWDKTACATLAVYEAVQGLHPRGRDD